MEMVEKKLLIGMAAKEIDDCINNLIVNEKNLAKFGLNPKEARVAILETISKAAILLLKEMEE